MAVPAAKWRSIVLAVTLNAAASVLQRRAAHDEPAEREFSLRLLLDLAHRPAWFVGIACVIAGFAAQAVTLTLGGVATVQPLLIAELPFTILLAAVVFHLRPGNLRSSGPRRVAACGIATVHPGPTTPFAPTRRTTTPPQLAGGRAPTADRPRLPGRIEDPRICKSRHRRETDRHHSERSTTMATPSDPDQSAAESSTADLMQTLMRDLRRLVREELATAKDELATTARRDRRAAVLLGAAAASGMLAGGTSAVVVLRALDRFLPPAAASAAATGLWAVGAVSLARAGLAELHRAGPLLPRRTAQNLRAEAESALADR